MIPAFSATMAGISQAMHDINGNFGSAVALATFDSSHALVTFERKLSHFPSWLLVHQCVYLPYGIIFGPILSILTNQYL